MDVESYVAAHRDEWDRLEHLSGSAHRLTGAEVDELVDLYRRASTQLSVVQSSSSDVAVVGKLTLLVARGRAAVSAATNSRSAAVSRFVLVVFPLAVYRARRWWLAVAVVFIVVGFALGAWVAGNPSVQSSLASPEEIRQLADQDFEAYYSSNPAGSFAARVWTNNAFVAALCIVFGVFLGIPVVFLLWQNVTNVAVAGGLMASAGKLDLFFGLILPHGLLELTAVFVAAGAGLRLGWTVIDPGGLPRGRALAERGREIFSIALGLVGVLLISGVIEAFVTPSPLPTFARIGIGFIAWAGFIAYVYVLGRRATRLGLDADVDDGRTATVAVSA